MSGLSVILVLAVAYVVSFGVGVVAGVASTRKRTTFERVAVPGFGVFVVERDGNG